MIVTISAFPHPHQQKNYVVKKNDDLISKKISKKDNCKSCGGLSKNKNCQYNCTQGWECLNGNCICRSKKSGELCAPNIDKDNCKNGGDKGDYNCEACVNKCYLNKTGGLSGTFT